MRILTDLARRPDGQRVSARLLGEAMNIPYPFARRIVTQLAAAGFVSTRRGVGGGVGLARAADSISLLEIINGIDGPVAVNECVTRPGACPRSSDCSTRDAWVEAGNVLARYLAERSLASLATARPGQEEAGLTIEN